MTESPEEKREAAAIRRRWITLGEVLAAVAVLISAATLWNSYQERTVTQAERAAAAAREEQAGTALVLKATAERDGRRLTIAPVEAGQVIQSQTFVFPTTLGVNPIETSGDPRIEAGWIADALKKSGAKAETAGDLRVPVAIVTRFTSHGTMRSDAALYRLAYERDGGLLGSTIRLRGLSLVKRIRPDQAQAAVDRL